MALLDQPDQERELITVEHFTNLSAEINYQLSATERDDEEALLALILGPARFSDVRPLLLAVKTIRLGYGQRRRKIGPLAVIHPLRTAGLLGRTMVNPGMHDILLGLLHDKEEDLTLDSVSRDVRKEYKTTYKELQDYLGVAKGDRLQRMVDVLTRESKLGYFEYLVELSSHAREMPELLHVKLADRLDNTLDNHIGRPGVNHYNFFRTIFDLLFVPVYQGVSIRRYHSLPDPSEGATLLSQLFKNAVFLSILRHDEVDKIDSTTQRLFDAVAISSIREAQWIALELFADYQGEEKVAQLREMVMDTMRYSIAGGATDVRASETSHDLDGLFLNNYAVADAAERKNRLHKLFTDREYLATTTVTFIATFASFLNDPGFSIRGIDPSGIRPA